jgi:pimeloyl-ACP methyl ester carboxylesterase
MQKALSSDGTEIAFDQLGDSDGPPVVLISGASCARGVHGELAGLLAGHFTVLNYDRRGRGDSGDTSPYAVQREIDDLAALLTAAGGEAAVFGNSSGAILGLRAAAAGLPITRLALWEPPFMTDPDAPRRQQAYVAELTALLGAGNRGDAMALFMSLVGLPAEMIAGMRHAPMWPAMEAIAPTLAYDAAVMGDSTVPPDLAAVKIPVLVLTGGNTGDWAANTALALTGALPDAQHITLDGQDHNVAWDVIAPPLITFFA